MYAQREAFFMRAAGVDYGHGWYWSKALPVDAVEALNTGFANGSASAGVCMRPVV